jgi:hypothetical protein
MSNFRLKTVDNNYLDVQPELDGVWITFQGKRQFFMKGTYAYTEVMKAVDKKCSELPLAGRGVTKEGRRFSYYGDINDIIIKENPVISWFKKLLS